MTMNEDLIELERAGWEALSAGADAAEGFYEDVLAPEVLMLLPGGMVLDNREQVIASMRGAPWDGFQLSDERVLRLGRDGAVVAYRASATRGGQEYEALFNSTYVLVEGRWRLGLHQQTPI